MTVAALKFRSRQKATQAVTPTAKSAIPTSNWNGLTSHPICAAAVAGKRTWEMPAHNPSVTCQSKVTGIHEMEPLGSGPVDDDDIAWQLVVRERGAEQEGYRIKKPAYSAIAPPQAQG